MSEYDMVSFIVAVIATAVVIRAYIKSRHSHGAESSGKIAELSKRIDNLESMNQEMQSRLHVLEEIVTSRDYDLKQKFRELEDG